MITLLSPLLKLTRFPSPLLLSQNFMGSDFFCFRACNPDDPEAAQYCECVLSSYLPSSSLPKQEIDPIATSSRHIYDTLGCGWNQPGNYDAGSFDECDADAVEKPVRSLLPSYSLPLSA
jgi:hypothetical protein